MLTAPDTEIINILRTSDLPEGSATKAQGKALPDTLPILGLSDIVVFPGMAVPLLVDSAQSIRLIDDVVAGNRFVGLVLQRNPEAENPTPEELHSHGCAGRVLKMLKFPDGTVRVMVEGLRRFRIKEFTAETPYLLAKVQWLKDVTDNSVELTALSRNAERLFLDVTKLSPTLSEQVKIAAINVEEPGRLSDLIAANLNLSLQERQNLLEIVSVKDRLTRLLPLLNRELEVLTLGTKIQNEVVTAMSKSQRDFFLREQIRAIQRELGDADPVAAEAAELREQIETKQLPEEAEKVALKELDRLQQMPPAAGEYALTRNYLDWLINLPWHESTEDKLDLDAASQILDEQHYGLFKVKERLLEFLSVIKLKQQLKGPILCLVGPPGVGKTSLGKSVADALGRKFARIALGGMHDEAEIRGHRRTYVGAMPGRIVQALRRVESCNPVILLDELDKVGSDFRGDPAAALLEVLDPAQNSSFTDNYLDLPFDLSRVLFITTANWLDPVHPALRDRLEVIELPSYTEAEKLQIAQRHLIPRQLEEHGVKRKLVRFSETALLKLIQDYTGEAGVRQLEREIAALIRKAARKIVSKRQPRPISITPKVLEDFLGPARFQHELSEKITEILFIEATRMPGKGNLLLTGSLGDIMKESAQAALSFLRSQAGALKLDLSDFDKHDIHIHVPAGATPKDGPSAGLTILAALASLLTRRLVRSGVAMTGEISLRGRVLRVGGIKEKILAAARSGIKEVILPDQNRNDWLDVPDEVREKLKVHFVQHISEVLPLALQSK